MLKFAVTYLPLLCLRDVGVGPRDEADDPEREGPLGGVSGGGEDRCGFLGGRSGGSGACSEDSPGRGGSGSAAAAVAVEEGDASGLYILARSFR